MSRSISCSNCGLDGHNKRTCSNNITLRSKRRVKRMQQRKRKLVTNFTPQKEEKSLKTCSICFDECKGKTCTLECGHTFHTKCIFTWFNKNNTCPMCRAEVKEMKNKVEQQVGKRFDVPPESILNTLFDMFEQMNQDLGEPPMTQREYAQGSMLFLQQFSTYVRNEFLSS